MRRKELIEVKTKEKCFELSDLKAHTEFTIGAKAENDSISKYLSLDAISNVDLSGKKVVSGKIYGEEAILSFSDGEIARFAYGEKIFSTYVKDKIERFISGEYLGKDTIFAITEQGTAISLNGDGVSFKLKKASCYLFFASKIFCAKDNKLYYAESSDLGFIDCPFNSVVLPIEEEIIGLFNVLQKIYIATKKAVYILTLGSLSEETVLKKLCYLQEEPIKDTIVQFKGKIYYLTKSGIKVLEGNAVKKLSSQLDGLTIKDFNKSSVIENFLVFKVDSEELIGYFAFDLIDGVGTFIEVMENVTVLDGGLIADNGVIYQLNINSSCKFYWFSKKTDLGEVKEKTIYMIELFSLYPSEIKLVYDNGEVCYSLLKGYNNLCVNIKTQSVSILICGAKKNSKVSSVKIYYRV